jgi:peptidoglycan/LPS O-acetylase OafA/YrhL
LNRPTSLYLDLVRPTAAVVVMLSHVSSQAGGQLRFFGSAGAQAVDIFFVLSGYVIAHVYTTRETDGRSYFVSRAARIYSVAIPAILLTAVLDGIGMSINSSAYQEWIHEAAFLPKLAIRSLLFLNEQWNSHRFPGTNGPYWSLGFEVWYYAAFGVFMFVSQGWRWLAAIAVLAFIGPKVALMFPIWLMGVLTYRHGKVYSLSLPTGWLFLAVSLILIVAYQFAPLTLEQQFSTIAFSNISQHYLIAGLFCANLVGFSSVSGVFAPLLERHAIAIRWIAGSTFSLYLAHVPIMCLLAVCSPWPMSSLWTLGLLLTGTPLLCLAFAELSERRKEEWRRSIDFLLAYVEDILFVRIQQSKVTAVIVAFPGRLAQLVRREFRRVASKGH